MPMRKAAGYFEGKHDFKAFTTAKKGKSTEKTIKKISVEYEGARAYIRIEADDFLHNMARYIIGMLLDVGNGLKKPEDVKRCLDGENVQMSLTGRELWAVSCKGGLLDIVKGGEYEDDY